MAGNPQVYDITGARSALSDEQRGRRRRYIMSMSIRTACFLGAVATAAFNMYVCVALVLGAVFLPYVAVVMANAGRENPRRAPRRVIVIPNTPQLPPGQPPIADMGRDGGSNRGSSMP